MRFNHKIGAREFELDVFASARDYQFRMRHGNEAIEFWGVLPETEIHVTQNKWGAAAVRQVVKSQNCELPRLQMYEVYLLNLWARELEAA